MRPEVELGTVIAERDYLLLPDKVVMVRIGQPFAPPEHPHESWCPYQIEGLGSGKVRYMSGVDGIQSLWLALQIIGVKLYASNEYKAGRLKLDEEDNSGNLHLPVTETLEHLLPPRS